MKMESAFIKRKKRKESLRNFLFLRKSKKCISRKNIPPPVEA